MKRRRMFKRVKDELREVDYYSKLTPEEKQYLVQFFMEYYQADFGYDKPIHPPELRQDCRDRDNANRRQIPAATQEARAQAEARAAKAQRNTMLKGKYYTPDDYAKLAEAFNTDEIDTKLMDADDL